jgi:hypothetical protein
MAIKSGEKERVLYLLLMTWLCAGGRVTHQQLFNGLRRFPAKMDAIN